MKAASWISPDASAPERNSELAFTVVEAGS
jgi:hypothetical protein